MSLPFRLLVVMLALAASVPVSGCRGQSTETDSADTVQADTGADTTASEPAPLVVTDGDTVAWSAGRVSSWVADDSLWAKALQIHFNAIVLDGHVDVPALMVDDGYDITQRHSSNRSHVDLPRMHEGGLDGAIFSIYVAPYYGEGARAVARARAQIDAVREQVDAAPGDVALARRAEEVREIAARGGTPILLGLEGGHALAGSPDTLRALASEGIRYVTLTHVNTNGWADSSQDEPEHGGLNATGEEMVRTMNDLGVLVDLAHVSDSTFADAVRVSRAPVIVSHSSCRALTPTVRNVSDEQLRAVAENGGVVMINFFDAMVNPHLDAELFAEARRRVRSSGRGMAYLWSAVYDLRRERARPGATWGDVVEHIDHAVNIAGIDHVGLGSDFDGVFDLPRGLRDVTALPRITYGLLRRGYAEEDIRKILGGNLLRALDEAERHAKK